MGACHAGDCACAVPPLPPTPSRRALPSGCAMGGAPVGARALLWVALLLLAARRRVRLALLALACGCAAPHLDAELRLSDELLQATDHARIVLSQDDDGPALFPPAPSHALGAGLSVRNFDWDRDGRVDVVVELAHSYRFQHKQTFALTPEMLSRAARIKVRVEIYDGYGNAVARLVGASGRAADDVVAAQLTPRASGALPSVLEPRCLQPSCSAPRAPSLGAPLALGVAHPVAALAAGRLSAAATADLVAGVPDEPDRALGPEAGAVQLITGGATGLAGPAAAIWRGAPGAHAGAALAIGDLDGDGAADLAIGAPGTAGAAGAIYVVFGGAPLVAESALGTPTLAGLAPGDRLGAALAARDLDGDGRDELIAGAPGAAGGAGAVYVVSAAGRALPADLSSVPSVRGGAGAGLGSVVAAAAGAVAAWAPGEPSVWLLDAQRDLGAPGGDGHLATREAGEGGNFGAALAFADLDGSGVPSLLVGAPFDGSGRLMAPGNRVVSASSGALLGAAVIALRAPLGDALVVAAPDGAGAAWLLRGEAVASLGRLEVASDGRPAALALAGAANDGLGAALAAGDFDGDGALDLALTVAGGRAISVVPGPLW
jgi:hypothetical protein